MLYLEGIWASHCLEKKRKTTLFPWADLNWASWADKISQCASIHWYMWCSHFQMVSILAGKCIGGEINQYICSLSLHVCLQAPLFEQKSHFCNWLLVQSTWALMCLGAWSLLGYVWDSDIKAVTMLPDLKEGEEEEPLDEYWDITWK